MMFFTVAWFQEIELTDSLGYSDEARLLGSKPPAHSDNNITITLSKNWYGTN